MAKNGVSFIEALFGLLLAPRSVTEQLFKQSDPPYVFTFLLLFIITIFVPLGVQVVSLQLLSYRMEFIISLLLVVTFSIIAFIVIETFFLRIIGVRVGLNQTTAAIAYSMVPLLLMIWIFYGLSWYFEGGLSIFTIMLTDSGGIGQELRTFMPYLIVIAQLGMLVTFFFCLREIGELYLSSALMVALVSILPLWGAILTGNLIGEVAFPGTLASLSRGFPGISVVQDIYNRIH